MCEFFLWQIVNWCLHFSWIERGQHTTEIFNLVAYPSGVNNSCLFFREKEYVLLFIWWHHQQFCCCVCVLKKVRADCACKRTYHAVDQMENVATESHSLTIYSDFFRPLYRRTWCLCAHFTIQNNATARKKERKNQINKQTVWHGFWTMCKLREETHFSGHSYCTIYLPFRLNKRCH